MTRYAVILTLVVVLSGYGACAQEQYTVEGRFGQALDASLLDAKALQTDVRPEYAQRPITVEAWVKTSYRDSFNVFAAYAPKTSARHWELYSRAQRGVFGVYLPGHEPATIDSPRNIADGQWHYVAMLLEEDRVRLYVDGDEVAARDLGPGGPAKADVDGALLIGAYTPDELGCEGLIDELRISRGLRDVSTVPSEPMKVDDDTIGLWSFDDYGFDDASPLQSRARLQAPGRTVAPPSPAAPEVTAKTGPGNRDYSAVSFDEKDGRFGRAFDPQKRSRYGATVRENPLYQQAPFTLECWVKLRADKGISNAIATGGYYQNPFGVMTNHWRLVSAPNTGYLRAYFQGNKPTNVLTKTDVADGEWHYVAMIVEPRRVRLYVDGELAAEETVSQPISVTGGTRRISEGPLMIGHNRPHKWLCHGLIDEMRMSTGTRDVTQVPDKPFEADERTTGLWHFDRLDDEGFVDSSGAHNWARVTPSANTLDENDLIEFGVKTTPFDRELTPLAWQVEPGMARAETLSRSRWEGAEEVMLNGTWDCVEAPLSGRSPVVMQQDDAWADSFPAEVPCTIQTALYEAGRLPDPMKLRNDEMYQWVPHREWWLRRQFDAPEHWRGQNIRLMFDGVDYRATFWLNGQRLGAHEGMWGGPAFDVSRYLRYGEQNELLVALDPAPWNYQDTLKNNVAYGWHYVKMVSLGIWRPVRLQMRGDAEMMGPFLTTTSVDGSDAKTALSIDIRNDSGERAEYELAYRLIPKNHDGPGYAASTVVDLEPGINQLGFTGVLESPALWWPVDMGDPNLYRFECELTRDGHLVDHYRSNWGARTIEMVPSGVGEDPETYNWQMLVNGQTTWIKGANWCPPDAMLRLDRNRFERYIELARHSHTQMFRVWGGGPIENDVLYDLCDEMGIMIQQEFSMLGYHRLQNVPSMDATDMTHYMVPRLRNRPSLAKWVGANETTGQGRIIEVLGRRLLELDGTRPFRRSCPAGGDLHYHIYWSQKPLPLLQELGQRPIAFTEFGMSSLPNWETCKRVLPEDEWTQWPPDRDAVVIHHTPTFIYRHVALTNRFAKEYQELKDLPSVIEGIQLSQTTANKFIIERMRSRKPDTTMTHVYKWTDNYPAASWALIDYYGVPKRSYYGLRDAHRPAHVMALFDDWDSADGKLPVEFSVVNDTTEPVSGEVEVVLLDGNLSVVRRDAYTLEAPTDRALSFGEVSYDVPDSVPRPLLLRMDWRDGDNLIDRNFYTFDFAEDSGCLFRLPRTSLSAKSTRKQGQRFLTVTNTGDYPAPCVEFDIDLASDTYYFSDMGFWLEPGEERTVEIIRTEPVEGKGHKLRKLTVKAWNADRISVKP